MPNGHTHRTLGAIAGGVAALYHARGEPARCMFIETLGGASGGMIAGMLPHRLDPPSNPRHRHVFHGFLLLLLIAFLVLDTQRKACRDRAANTAVLGANGPQPTLESDGW